MLHNNKLYWIEFYSNGNNLIGFNDALLAALNRKYGQSEPYEYRDLFGKEIGKKWLIGDTRILLKPSTLVLESKSGREEMNRRNKQKQNRDGSAL